MRIHITGASGSGTSTLGRALADALGCAFLDGDDYYWIEARPPFEHKRAPALRAAQLRGDLSRHARSVLAGSIVDWDAEIEDAFDLIVFLRLDTALRVARLRAREIERFGVADEAFLAWAADYDGTPAEGRSLAKHRAWLAQRRCPVLELQGDLSVAERVAAVRAQL